MNYRVTVYVESPYYTEVEAATEEEAIKIALEREGPSIPAYTMNLEEEEWVPDHLLEFPNLGRNEKPEVEEI